MHRNVLIQLSLKNYGTTKPYSTTSQLHALIWRVEVSSYILSLVSMNDGTWTLLTLASLKSTQPLNLKKECELIIFLMALLRSSIIKTKTSIVIKIDAWIQVGQSLNNLKLTEISMR